MKIQKQFNAKGQLVVWEDGKSLCSFQDPKREALVWVERLDLKRIQHLLVLGLGAGYHVEAIAEKAPQVKLSVIDHREELFEDFAQRNPEIFDRVSGFTLKSKEGIDERVFKYICDTLPTVVGFRPCWQNHENFYSNLTAQLTFRQPEMLRRYFSASDIGFEPSHTNHLLHLRDLYESLRIKNDETGLALSVLKELWV